MTESSKKNNFDLITRGEYASSPLGTTVFVGLRVLDGFVLQRALQVVDPVAALCARLGFSVPPPPTGGLPLAASDHDLTPFQAVIWGFCIASALKQIFWLLVTSKDSFPVSAAIPVAIFNTLTNSLNTLIFSLASVNPTWSETGFYASIPIFISGILIETISEIQRKRFKDDPRNKGKLFSGGLFGVVRHPNYLGYMLWRGSFALAAGGWAWGALVASSFWYDFNNRSIPVLDEYCTKRYGEQWQAVKRKVPYAFFPGVQ